MIGFQSGNALWKCKCVAQHSETHWLFFCRTHKYLCECECMPSHKTFAQRMCMCEHVNFTPSLIYWAASCLSDYPASSRCQICHLQMSGRVCGAEEWREEIGVKRERKQDNWFCRYLELVQTGQQRATECEWCSGDSTCLIEKVAF